MKNLEIAAETRELIESIIKQNPNYDGNEKLLDMFCESIYNKSYLLIDAIKDKVRLRRHLVTICNASMEQIIKEKLKTQNGETDPFSLEDIDSINTDSENLELKELAKLSAQKFNKQQKKLPNFDYNNKKTQNKNETSSEKYVEEEDYIGIKNSYKIDKANKVNNIKPPKKELMGLVDLRETIQSADLTDGVSDIKDPLEICKKKITSKNTVDKLIRVMKNINAKYPKRQYFDIFVMRYMKGYNEMQIARELKISQVELSKRFVEMIKLVMRKS